MPSLDLPQKDVETKELTFCNPLELSLESLKYSCLVGNFCPLLTFQNVLGVSKWWPDPYFSEIKDRHLTLATRQLYENEFYGKVLKELKMMI